jgi:hypothetical protein
MKAFIALAVGVSLLAVACRPRKPGATSVKDPSGGDPVLGAVQNVRRATQRIQTANELKGLHIYISDASLTSGRMPSKEEIVAAAKQSNDAKLVKYLEDGIIVLTGTKSREGVWAYEKDAPAMGGWVVTASGPQQMTAEQLKQQLQQEQ